jgi:hypothetical protein
MFAADWLNALGAMRTEACAAESICSTFTDRLRKAPALETRNLSRAVAGKVLIVLSAFLWNLVK